MRIYIHIHTHISIYAHIEAQDALNLSVAPYSEWPDILWLHGT